MLIINLEKTRPEIGPSNTANIP